MNGRPSSHSSKRPRAPVYARRVFCAIEAPANWRAVPPSASAPGRNRSSAFFMMNSLSALISDYAYLSVSGSSRSLIWPFRGP